MFRKKTRNRVELLLSVILLASICCLGAQAQSSSATILEIDVENQTQYVGDTTDVTKFATDPGSTIAAMRDFLPVVVIGDIVAVNGESAKGTVVFHLRTVNLRIAPNPGDAAADTVRNGLIEETFEILRPDGTAVGTIMGFGLSAGSPPPGAPLSVTQANVAIIGGTGAFLGVRGQIGQAVTAQTIAARAASMTEDPAKRRINGGGKVHFTLHLLTASQPQIIVSASGPAITHSTDFTLVTASKPAAAGELLSLFATGLGPTRPGVDPGKPLPSSPAQVIAPVAVTVNGKSAQVLAAVGFPGAVDGYQVNFRLPPDAATGNATLQLSAAWIAGPSVQIPIQ